MSDLEKNLDNSEDTAENLEKNLDNSEDTAETSGEKIVSETTDEIVEDTQTSIENTNNEEESSDDKQYVSQFSDIDGITYEEESPEEEIATKKKKSFIMPTVIIALSIVLVAAIGAGVYLMFFNNTIAGTWQLPLTDKENKATATYLTFENDIAKMSVGTMEMSGTYKIVAATKDAPSTVSIEIPYNISGSFGYKIEGNLFTGKTLTLSNSEMTEDVVLTSASLPASGITAKPDNKMDKKIVDKWTVADYGISYTFNNNGTMVMKSNDMTVNANYSAENGTIKITYMATTEQNMELTYSVDGDILVLDGTMTFVREGSDATAAKPTQPATQAETQPATQAETQAKATEEPTTTPETVPATQAAS